MNSQQQGLLDRSRYAAAFVCVLGAFLFGYIWNIKPDWSPNDRSRWNTVWSLVDFGEYQIYPTQAHADKYGRPRQFATIDRIVKFEPDADRTDETNGRSFSSKPPLLATVIAGYVWTLKHTIVGMDFGGDVSKSQRWPAFHIYAKSTLYVFQVIPFLLFVWLYAKLIGRLPISDFTWLVCVAAAGIGTFVTGYLVTLNNHVIAASFGFFTVYLLNEGRKEPAGRGWRFFLAGLCAGWTAANELPAGLLVIAAILYALYTDWKKGLLCFLPGLAMVTAAFFTVNKLAIDSFRPAYVIQDLYDYPGSHFSDKFQAPQKSAIDALNENPEPLAVYFLHMTVGHHGVFSLSPILIFSVLGAWKTLRGADSPASGWLWPIVLVSAGVFVFFWIPNDQRNYGGYCHGMRWLMWLNPVWLLFLPAGLEAVARSAKWRAAVIAALAVSVFSMADTLPGPWSYSWLHETMNWLGLVRY